MVVVKAIATYIKNYLKMVTSNKKKHQYIKNKNTIYIVFFYYSYLIPVVLILGFSFINTCASLIASTTGSTFSSTCSAS